MAACAAQKVAEQAAIAVSRVSMVALRTTPQGRPFKAKAEHTSDVRVLVGIDFSKHRHEVLISVPGKARRRRLTITSNADDFMRVIEILWEYGLPVRIGFEAQTTITVY